MIEREQRIQNALDRVRGSLSPHLPTDAPPGSLLKIAILRERAALGLPLHLPGDRKGGATPIALADLLRLTGGTDSKIG